MCLNSTHCIARRGTKEDGVRRVDLVASDALLGHLALHELLVRPEVDAIARSFTQQGDSLSLVDTCNAPLAIDFPDGIPWAVIETCLVWLCLETYK